MRKPNEVTIQEIQQRHQRVKDLGDFGLQLQDWLNNRKSNASLTENLLSFQRFLTNSFSDIQVLLHLLNSKPNKRKQVRIFSEKIPDNLEKDLNKFMAMHPQKDFDIQFSIAPDGHHTALVSSDELNSQFSDYIDGIKDRLKVMEDNYVPRVKQEDDKPKVVLAFVKLGLSEDHKKDLAYDLLSQIKGAEGLMADPFFEKQFSEDKNKVSIEDDRF